MERMQINMNSLQYQTPIESRSTPMLEEPYATIPNETYGQSTTTAPSSSSGNSSTPGFEKDNRPSFFGRAISMFRRRSENSMALPVRAMPTLSSEEYRRQNEFIAEAEGSPIDPSHHLRTTASSKKMTTFELADPTALLGNNKAEKLLPTLVGDRNKNRGCIRRLMRFLVLFTLLAIFVSSTYLAVSAVVKVAHRLNSGGKKLTDLKKEDLISDVKEGMHDIQVNAEKAAHFAAEEGEHLYVKSKELAAKHGPSLYQSLSEKAAAVKRAIMDARQPSIKMEDHTKQNENVKAETVLAAAAPSATEAEKEVAPPVEEAVLAPGVGRTNTTTDSPSTGPASEKIVDETVVVTGTTMEATSAIVGEPAAAAVVDSHPQQQKESPPPQSPWPKAGTKSMEERVAELKKAERVTNFESVQDVSTPDQDQQMVSLLRKMHRPDPKPRALDGERAGELGKNRNVAIPYHVRNPVSKPSKVGEVSVEKLAKQHATTAPTLATAPNPTAVGAVVAAPNLSGAEIVEQKVVEITSDPLKVVEPIEVKVVAPAVQSPKAGAGETPQAAGAPSIVTDTITTAAPNPPAAEAPKAPTPEVQAAAKTEAPAQPQVSQSLTHAAAQTVEVPKAVETGFMTASH